LSHLQFQHVSQFLIVRRIRVYADLFGVGKIRFFDKESVDSTCLAAAVLLAGCSVEAFLPTTGMFSRVGKRSSGNLATLSMKDAALIVQNKVVSSGIIFDPS
jgi:hypothetical protein